MPFQYLGALEVTCFLRLGPPPPYSPATITEGNSSVARTTIQTLASTPPATHNPLHRHRDRVGGVPSEASAASAAHVTPETLSSSPNDHPGGTRDQWVTPETLRITVDALANLSVTSQPSLHLASPISRRVTQGSLLTHLHHNPEYSGDSASAEAGAQGNDAETSTPARSNVDTASSVTNQGRHPDYSRWSPRNHSGWFEDSLLSGIFHPAQNSESSTSDTTTNHQTGTNRFL